MHYTIYFIISEISFFCIVIKRGKNMWIDINTDQHQKVFGEAVTDI